MWRNDPVISLGSSCCWLDGVPLPHTNCTSSCVWTNPAGYYDLDGWEPSQTSEWSSHLQGPLRLLRTDAARQPVTNCTTLVLFRWLWNRDFVFISTLNKVYFFFSLCNCSILSCLTGPVVTNTPDPGINEVILILILSLFRSVHFSLSCHELVNLQHRNLNWQIIGRAVLVYRNCWSNRQKLSDSLRENDDTAELSVCFLFFFWDIHVQNTGVSPSGGTLHPPQVEK